MAKTRAQTPSPCSLEIAVDSFGFAASAVPCCNGERKTGRLRNYPWWVSVPADEVGVLRYRDVFKLRSGEIVVQDVMGARIALEKVVSTFSLHPEKPE